MAISLRRFTKRILTSADHLYRYHRPDWLYRGHGDASWHLETSFDRSCKRHRVPIARRERVEEHLLREFRRAYHDYATYLPKPDATLEWLALMRHHGAPSRFLDFSYSIYHAAYFATETAEGDAAIWAINAQWARLTSIQALADLGRSESETACIVEPSVEASDAAVAALLFSKPPGKYAMPANPFRLNERLRVQKGVFLAPGSSRATFEDNLVAMPRHQRSSNVFRLVIPRRLVEPLRKRLFEMGISRRSLFPGLDGYATSLDIFHPIFDPRSAIWTII